MPGTIPHRFSVKDPKQESRRPEALKSLLIFTNYVKMPTTTREEREKRRGTVALLKGIGLGPYEIAKVVEVSPPTIYKDLEALERSAGEPISNASATAQLRGVTQSLVLPLQEYLQHPDPKIRLMTIRTIWTIYERKIALEQAFGFMPREAETKNTEGDVAEALRDYFLSVGSRMTSEASQEMARAMRAVEVEAPKLVKKLEFYL